MAVDTLASYRRWLQRAQGSWPAFLAERSERLVQQQRYGVAEERVAENILEDLFTQVLGWSLSEVNNQIDYADLVLTRLGINSTPLTSTPTCGGSPPQHLRAAG